jgi:hypothetical protein
LPRAPERDRFVRESVIMKLQVPDDIVSGVLIHFIENFVLVDSQSWFLSKMQGIPGLIRPDFVLEVRNKLLSFERIRRAVAKIP